MNVFLFNFYVRHFSKRHKVGIYIIYIYIYIIYIYIACLNFTFESEDLFCWHKQKSDFYELWQQHKQLKTMDISEA